MLSLEVRRSSPIFRLGAKGYMDSVQHARVGVGKAGRPGVGPDVRWLARCRMSELRCRMSEPRRTWLFCSLDGRRRMSARRGQMSATSGGAGCPGRSPDVRADAASFCALKSLVLDVRDLGRISGGGRMSGLDAGCPVAVVSSEVGWPCRSPGAGCPGSWPDVRCLEDVLAFFRWFSSSVDLGS